MALDYDRFNREERALCAHLFRPLREGLATNPEAGPFRAVVNLLDSRRLQFSGPPVSLREAPVAAASILCKVALIRDAYEFRRHEPHDFMKDLVAIVAERDQAMLFSV